MNNATNVEQYFQRLLHRGTPSIFIDSIPTRIYHPINHENRVEINIIDDDDENEHLLITELNVNENGMNSAANNVEVVAEQCTICLIDFAMNDELRILPCAHEYHKECIDRWLQQSTTCPMCRHDVMSSPT